LSDRLFPDGEDNGLGSVSERMRHCLATIGGPTLRPADLAPEISLSGKGLRNAAGLFLSEEGTFTRAAAEDLEAIRDWPVEKRIRTALATVFSETGPVDLPDKRVDVIATGTRGFLTDRQMEAAEAALAGPLTVLQGPPGSGKSEVISSLIISAVLNGKTVLFSAKNHQAVDEVEGRIKAIAPEFPLLTRARDAQGERDVSFLDALIQLGQDDTRQLAPNADIEPVSISIRRRANEHQDQRRRLREEIALHLALSELSERREMLGRTVKVPRRLKARFKWSLPLLSVFAFFRRRRKNLFDPLAEDASLRDVDNRISDIRKHLSERKADAVQQRDHLDSAQVELNRDISTFLPRLAAWITRPTEPERQQLSEKVKELEFTKIKSGKRLAAEDARAVLRHRPVWAVSTLSAPSRIPLVPGLFDYVIFDETSQSDIASALPLLARATKTVVVGDPMQLSFVRPLGIGAEHALMDAAGLPKRGRSTFAQSVNSLFDFCASRPVAKRLLLVDQFRSAPAIVDYLNSDFYDGRLIGRRGEEHFRPPNGYLPGLAWEDVSGHETRREGGPVNVPEAKQVASLLKRLSEDCSFNGHVGVISPFNAQVAEIQKAVQAHVSEATRKRFSLRVATVDKFQGGEADIIVFSLVLAANSPQSTRSFLQKERRRFNVAVSRARALCIVVGDLTYAKHSRIRHIEFLAERASKPWSPPKPNLFDSSWERRLDVAMRERGLTPYPQYPVGRRYLDFALDPDGLKLNIEVDGRRWHTDASGNRKVADRLRDQEMRARGWKVLRFWVHQLAEDMEACLDSIEHELDRR
jgi:very-short-patch-repair endonuclease